MFDKTFMEGKAAKVSMLQHQRSQITVIGGEELLTKNGRVDREEN